MFESDELSETNLDASHTADFDTHALLKQVQPDETSAIPATVRMEAITRDPATVRLSAVGSDVRPTIPMMAIGEATRPVSNALDLEELDIELEPIDEDHASTLTIPVRMDFEVVVEPGGVLRIPHTLMQSGHLRPGMKLKIIASQIG